MHKLTKRMKLIQGKVDHTKQYPVEAAFSLLSSLASAKFVETVDVAINLGVNAKKSDQAVRGSTTLPNGLGKQVRIAVFAQGANAEAAKAAGADIVGMEDLAAQVKAGNMEFDVVIASKDTMRIVGQLGKILGPRGLMPNPKTGTVIEDNKNIADAVRNFKAGQVRYRIDKGGVIHCAIGKVSFTPIALRQNLEVLLHDLQRIKPSTSKGVYFKKISVSTTMGPGIQLDQTSLSFFKL